MHVGRYFTYIKLFLLDLPVYSSILILWYYTNLVSILPEAIFSEKIEWEITVTSPDKKIINHMETSRYLLYLIDQNLKNLTR